MVKSTTDLNEIVAALDEAEGRTIALVTYIFALRDLQCAHDEYSMYADGPNDAEIVAAQKVVSAAFDSLIAREFSLNRPSYSPPPSWFDRPTEESPPTAP